MDECEVCGLRAELECPLCGRRVCMHDFDFERGVCAVCSSTLCELCGAKLSIGCCRECGRLVCADCSREEGVSLVCLECLGRSDTFICRKRHLGGGAECPA